MSTAVTPLTPQQAQISERGSLDHTYPVRVALSLDKLLATAFYMTRDTDKTMSTVFAEWATRKPQGSFDQVLGQHMCDFLNLFSKDHGAKAELGDLARAQATVNAIETDPTVQQEGQ